MLNSDIVGTYGLTQEQNEEIKKNLPTKACKVMDTDIFTDIIAIDEFAVVADFESMSTEERDLMVEFYSDIAPFSETVVLIGGNNLTSPLVKHFTVYDNFESFAENMKYIFLNAYRKRKKSVNFSNTLANSIMILSQIRQHPYITTKELAEKLELSSRTIQRYIETLRVAGEWIEYDTVHKGWTLFEGKSVLWGDLCEEDGE